MDPLNTRALRKATLKKRKVEMALIIGEPSGVQAVFAPEPKIALAKPQEATPPPLQRTLGI